MNRASDRPGERRAGQGAPDPVSPAMIPMLLAGLVVGFASTYFLLWWALVVVLAVLLGAFAWVWKGRDKDAATGAVVGTLLGFVGVILLALFRGAL